jgi:hypothetical protein
MPVEPASAPPQEATLVSGPERRTTGGSARIKQARKTARRTGRTSVKLVRNSAKTVLRPASTPLKSVRRRLPASVDRALSKAMGIPPQRTSRKAAAPLPPREEWPPHPPVPQTPSRLYVGPANFAGQGHQWAKAVERHVPGVGAVSMGYVTGTGFGYPVDQAVPQDLYLRSWDWQQEQHTYVRENFTHVLIEAHRPLFGSLFASSAFVEARVLTGHGLRVATIAHGRDVRLPSRHRRNYEWSPYDEDEWSAVPVLENQVNRNFAGLATIADLDIPTFVSTPDLLDDLPTATWCPVVVDAASWATDTTPLQRERPVVVHAPTSSNFKGSAHLDPLMKAMDEAGLIEYRRIEGVPAAEMRGIIQSADILLEQFRLGSYGVTACEGMAAGRVVVSHVAERNRERVRAAHGEDVPIIEATLDDVEDVVRRILADRQAALATAAQGPAYVRAMHDGTYSARVLAQWLEA